MESSSAHSRPHRSAPWFLTGATASGKTRVGIELARLLDAEIISMDSMALYRGMDVGTAKPTPEERRQVPHYLIDILWPDEQYSLAQYVSAAWETAESIAARGKRVLFVGGTPLYLKALLRGIFLGPPADWDLRRHYQAMAREEGPEALHRMLSTVDATTARRLHARDIRRVIRALEVYEKTGRPISALQHQFERAGRREDSRVFAIGWPREELLARIDARVESMFAGGLVDEVRGLLDRYASLSHTALQALGYREVIAHLWGEQTLAETVQWVKTRTRQFAKRQLTWIRSLSECRDVAISGSMDPAAIAKIIASSAQ